MCGIIGRTGNDKALPYLIDGLGKLEYRGYDSAGVSVMENGKIKSTKAVGKLDNLKEKVKNESFTGVVGIGHTRWATHGAPSENNAHPHISADKMFSVVHNGIIENAEELKKEKLPGVDFVSETDTEVIAQLLGKYYYGDPIKAISAIFKLLRGSYACGILCADYPDTLFCTASSSPLIAAKGNGGGFIASDMGVVSEYTDCSYPITDGEICAVTGETLDFYNADGEKITKEPVKIQSGSLSVGKGGYEHYMMLEIMQQPDAVRNTLKPLINNGEISFPDIKLDEEFVAVGLKSVIIVACGSAYHTGLVGQRLFEKLCNVPCRAEIASEFRYSDPLIDESTLCVFISQSGETADTLAALRLAKEKGGKVLSIVNVQGSAIDTASDNCIYTRAGREIAVATTKAYSAQLSVLYALTLYIARIKNTVTPEKYSSLVHELLSLPEKILETITDTKEQASALSQKLKDSDDMYFIGRQLDFAAAMEGSLKMKEISYVHSEAYAAGELKHGTISLVNDGTPVVSIATGADILAKTNSNTCEVKARGADTIVITNKKNREKIEKADTVFTVPDTAEEFSVSLTVPVLQLLGYYTAKNRGCDIDKPKNLAKSVTVE